MPSPTSSLPLIRLSSINPFLLELDRRNIDSSVILRRMGLPGQIPASSELFASALTIYEIVEECALAADDPHLGYTIGQNLDLKQWDPIAKALVAADTVGDLLRFFVVNALEHSSSTDFFVQTQGKRSTFGFTRVVTPTFTPAQIDAFYFSFFGKLLRQATGPLWDPLQVIATISYPKAVPPRPENPRIAQGDHGGMKYSFPTAWQFSELRKSEFSVGRDPSSEQHIPNSLIQSVRSALRPHLHEPNLTVERAASICGYGKRKLSRSLRDEGTTIVKEIAALRAEFARSRLTQSNMRIAEIGAAVGFNDPTIFSRAFKNWTTQSPQEYRRNHKS